MIIQTNGWVVINIGHPSTGGRYIVGETFSSKRTNAIKKFIDGSGNDWIYWKVKYNFRVVKSTQSVTVNDI